MNQGCILFVCIQIPTSPRDLISTKNLFSIQDKIYYLTIHSSGLQITIMLAGHLMAHSWLVYNTPTSQSCCGRLCRYCQHIHGYTGQKEAQAHSAKCFRALRDSRPQRNADAIHHRRGELREKFGQIGINTGSCDNLRLVCVHKYSGSLEHLQKILPPSPQELRT